MLNASMTDVTPRRKRFAVLFDDLQSVHLFKDVGQIPFQMYRHFGYEAEIVCRQNEERYLYLDDALQGLKVVFHNGHPYRYLLKEAGNIDVLMLFHVSTETIYRGLLYKALNPAGCLYVKADMNGDKILYAQWGERNVITQAKRMVLFNLFAKRVDIVTFETERSYRGVDNIPPEKKLLLPNGFDPDFIDWYGVRRRQFAEKENIILLVSRHGDYAKNSELMFDALGEMGDIGEWQVWFVGPMTDGFKKRRDRFVEQFPLLAEKVVCTGQIDDKRQLFDLYSRARVLCLTSRWESWGMVCVEAMAFGCVPVMTAVSSAEDITGNGTAGRIVEQENSEHLARTLKDICADPETLQTLSRAAHTRSRERFTWKDSLVQLDRNIECR